MDLVNKSKKHPIAVLKYYFHPVSLFYKVKSSQIFTFYMIAKETWIKLHCFAHRVWLENLTGQLSVKHYKKH